MQAKTANDCKRILLTAALLLLSLPCLAQDIRPVESAAGGDLHVSPVMGINGSVDYTAQHNSDTGWANIVTPGLSYRFNKHFSANVNVPWYLTVNAFVPTTSGGVTTYPLLSARNLLGDTDLSVHFEAAHNNFNYLLTPTVGFATGNAKYGLSANTTTYNITNHFDYVLGPFDPDIEFGEGNSSALANQNIRHPYVAVGPVANFQAGTSIDLPLNLSLDLEAYEALPIGNQKVYGSVTRKAKSGKKVTRQVLEGTGVAEDNGFISELDIPVGRHFVVAGEYDRSLIQGLDTASIGITWTARSPKISRSH